MERRGANVYELPAFLEALKMLCDEYRVGFASGTLRLTPMQAQEKQVLTLTNGPSVQFSLTKGQD